MAGRKPVKGAFMNNEVSVQDKMAAINKRMLHTIICLVLGWAMLLFGAVTLSMSTVGGLLVLLSFLIAPAPMLGRMWKGGFKTAFNLPEYTVVTTYASGRKESDYGAQSAMVNLIVKGFFLVIGIIIGFIATAIYLVILIIKYIALYTQAKPKPAFIRTAFFLLIIAVLSLPGIIVLSGLGRNAISRADYAAFRKEHSAFISAVENAERQNVTAYTMSTARQARTVSMGWYDDPDSRQGWNTKWIPIGETVIIVGPVSGRSVPVLHEGDKGTISIENLSLTPPNQTLE
jgi:hypothetical protein